MTPGIDRLASLRANLLQFSALSIALCTLAGCGSGSSSNKTSTSVRVLATSTADDRLTQYTMGLSSLSLVTKDGKEVPVIASPIYAEFIHLNGVDEPLLTASIPAGTYTAAKATIGFSMFYCVDVSQQGGLNGQGFGGGNVKSNKVTITLPQAIEIGGDSSTILLDMLAGPSSSKALCDAGINSFSVTPTFTLTQPATSSAASVSSLQGVVQAVNGDGSFTVSSIDGPALSYTGLTGKTEQASSALWEFSAASDATYTGIHDASDIVPGLAVDVDVSMTSGALKATRIATYDANGSNLNVFTGPLLSAKTTSPVFSWVRGGIGNPPQAGMTPFNLIGAKFAISSAFTNLASLPFTPRFDESTFTWGQVVSITTHQPLYTSSYAPVA